MLIDAKALCFTAMYANLDLTTSSALGTGIVFGFFNQIQGACKQLGISNLVFCWDSKRSHRKRIFPAYKEKRGASPDRRDAYIQFAKIQYEILPRLGFVNSFCQTGFEADDLIACICQDTFSSANQFTILSDDHDFYQLLDTNVQMFKLRQKKLFTAEDFERKYGILPHEWVNVKILAGCNSDGVPGIPSIGEGRALEFIIKGPGKAYLKQDKIEAHREILQRNEKLVRLPFEGAKVGALVWDKRPSFAEWLNFCEEYEFHSFLRDQKTWESIFSGIPPSSIYSRVSQRRRNRAYEQKQ